MRGWVKIDHDLTEHPKLEAVGPIAGWLYLCSITYCSRHLTDGRFPGSTARRLAADFYPQQPNSILMRLVDVGLWEENEDSGDYIVHDYLSYQLSKAQIAAMHEARSTAGQAGGQASAQARAQAKSKQSSSRTRTRTRTENKNEKPSYPSLSPRYAAAYETLRGIEKSGYGERKFTLERFAELVAQHPTVDILVEAERLRDWETYGVGENQQTRDGILRLRNWLTKAEEHRQPEVVTGYDDSLPLGGLRHLTPADRGLEWSEEHGEWRNPWEM